MSKFVNSLCASLCVFSFVYLSADEPSLPVFSEIMPEISSFSSPLPTLQQEAIPIAEVIPAPVAPKTQPRVAAHKAETPFSPFTGKIKGRKVRLRLRPDLDSRIIKELNKN
jgi:hypothetical protein